MIFLRSVMSIINQLKQKLIVVKNQLDSLSSKYKKQLSYVYMMFFIGMFALTAYTLDNIENNNQQNIFKSSSKKELMFDRDMKLLCINPKVIIDEKEIGYEYISKKSGWNKTTNIGNNLEDNQYYNTNNSVYSYKNSNSRLYFKKDGRYYSENNCYFPNDII